MCLSHRSNGTCYLWYGNDHGTEHNASTRNIKPVSVNIELRALKAAFNVAKQWRLISENPCEGVTQMSTQEEHPNFFNPSDFEVLLGAIDHEWPREMVLFAVLP